jgi:hypothetical protein
LTISGWYYLHTNGSLIYKRDTETACADIRDSDFALMLWPVDHYDRESAWRIVIEACALGCSAERINELAAKWHCTDKDAAIYAARVGCLLSKDGPDWCATRRDFVDLASSPAGFGKTALEAMAALCKDLGYRPSKMWGATFVDHLNAGVAVN